MPTISDCQLIQLPKIKDTRGNLSIIEQLNEIPFEIKRVYWIYDVPSGFDRGEHALKRTEEFIVALSGSFDVELDDGKEKKIFQLNRSYMGVYVAQGMWRKMCNFSTNSLALVISSTPYDEHDYIEDYNDFIKWAKSNRKIPAKPIVKEENSNDHLPKPVNYRNTSVFDCSLYELNKYHHEEGNLTYIYENQHVPFPISRVFYSYDIPAGEFRGAHAHKECHQFVIAASGSFEVILDDGSNRRTITLNRPFMGLHIPPGIWASEQEFSSGSICLVITSHKYSENEYLRKYGEFLKYKKNLIENNPEG